MQFTEENIRKLFGPEAAEDEDISRLKEYYFKGTLYDKVHNDLPLRILVGHKGIGKSATFKISHYDNLEANNISVWIRPDDIMEICNDEQHPLLQRIRDWKQGLLNIIFHKVMDNLNVQTKLDNKVDEAINCTGKLIANLIDIFSGRIKKYADIKPVENATISTFLNKKKIYVYIDDLDRGWEGTEHGVKRISALLNASRDITNDNPGLCIRISLRSDVYFLVRTSDESTDKIEGAVIWYTWTQHQILVLLAKRIQLFFGHDTSEEEISKMPQSQIAEFYNPVFEYMFHAKGKWSNIPTYKMLASMIRRRPRDLIKICTLAARKAYERGHSKIDSEDFEDNFDYYSQERLQDTINEYKSELPDIERLLLGMKPSKRERKTRDAFVYSTEDLLKKIDIISKDVPFLFSNKKVASISDLAGFLYKINFLVAKKRIVRTKYIDRKYFEEHKYLSNSFTDFGYKWEVHPAFRWALYPDGGEDIFASLAVEQ